MAQPIASSVPASPVPQECCLGSTCLQWRADGELAEPDAALVLARLLACDPLLAALLAGAGEGEQGLRGWGRADPGRAEAAFSRS